MERDGKEAPDPVVFMRTRLLPGKISPVHRQNPAFAAVHSIFHVTDNLTYNYENYSNSMHIHLRVR